MAFPIPARRPLRLITVADCWSREATPSASLAETVGELMPAWWRGELPAEGIERVNVLRALFKVRRDSIAFVAPGEEEPLRYERTSDGAGIVLRALLVPLPNFETKTWNDENCASAYEALAEGWPNIERDSAFVPILAGIMLTRDAFFDWHCRRGGQPLRFWGAQPPSDSPEEVAPVGLVTTSALGATSGDDTTELRPATDVIIDAEITAVYDEADKIGSKAPNIVELPNSVLPRLAAKGYRSSKRNIQKLGEQQVHASRRRKAGRTLASERKRPRA